MTDCDTPGRDLAAWETSEADEPLVYTARSIGFLGPRGTFTEEALVATLAALPGGGAADGMPLLVPFPTIEQTVRAASTGDVDCAIVPLENSIEGSVSVTADLLAHEVENVQMVREVRIPIRHRLIARPGVGLSDIVMVASHPHANAQCRRWLADHLPGVEIEAANSTAKAVERVANVDAPWAAIGTEIAALEHGCVVLEEDIEDHDYNETRFAFLSRLRERQDLDEPYKTSLVCRILKDQPGALLLILQEFAHRYINLTKIESRPSKRGLGDYLFLIDVEGSISEPRIEDALRCLTCKLLDVKVLGSYPVGIPRTTQDGF